MADNETTEQAPAPVRTKRERASPIIERNVRALVELAVEQERAKSFADRIAITISNFAGTMNFVYFHTLLYGVWAAADLGFLGFHNFDRDLIGLNTVATVEAIFLATFVLIAQNRLTAQAEIRNHLDVQVGLLTESETTHILRLVVAMSKKMDINEANDPEIAQLLRDVEPQEMIDQIEVHADKVEEQIKEEIKDARAAKKKNASDL
jgi:uncharacterized membrane protein